MKSIFITWLLVLLVLAAACAHDPEHASSDERSALTEAANRLAQTSIIVDTHIDLPYRLAHSPANVTEPRADGDFDYPRAIEGGLDAPFMSIYTAASLEADGRSREAADSLIDSVEALARAHADKFSIARSVADVRRNFSTGVISLPLGMENGSPIDGDLASLRHFFDRGIRYVSLVHSTSNHLSDSSYDEYRQWNGLSRLGVDVVREMNRLGMMIDVSHASDDAFWQILAISETPVIASHSSARHFTPGFERNMSDDMIRALGDQGGVIQINFGSAFISQASRVYSEALWASHKTFAALHPELDPSESFRRHSEVFRHDNGPMPLATLDDVLDHFDHVVGLVGIEHVGIGSDFDGVGDTLPAGLEDVSRYPNLIKGLMERGYSASDIRKILGENLLRVWQQVEEHAAEMELPGPAL